ncbi:MAG: Fic family protein [Campylobacterota bacterium]|nr:Fic family protein [Campylobacterota bacterium]
MVISPITPTDIRNNIDESLLKKAEDVLIESATLYGGQSAQLIAEVKELLRKVNSYYSNRIESEGTHPLEIEKAMRREYSSDTKKRRLQLLSLAHIEVQKEIENAIDTNSVISPYSKEFIKSIHGSFYNKEGMNDFLTVKGDGMEIEMEPGSFRALPVSVSGLVPLLPDQIESAMLEFENGYGRSLGANKSVQLIHALSSHHRLTWIHPFLDGNGRTSRLALDAALYHMKMPGYGLWNISRGLAKNSEKYKDTLKYADMIRQGSTDGRGNLSAKALNVFVDYMLEIAQDQIRYMNKYLRIGQLSDRINSVVKNAKEGFIDIEPLPKESEKLFDYLLIHGEVARGEVGKIVGYQERQARKLTSALTDRGFLTSDTPKAPIRIRFDAVLTTYLFPDLVPEQTVE